MKRLLAAALTAAVCMVGALPAAAADSELLGATPLDDTCVDFRWRLDLPDYAADFYDALCEGSDNDGTNDWLIDFNDQTALVFPIPSDVDISEARACFLQSYLSFCYDHPECFWLNTYALLGQVDGDGLTVAPSDLILSDYEDCSGAQLRSYIRELEGAVEDIKSGSVSLPDGGTLTWNDGMSKLDKLRFFNAWLVMNNQYCDYGDDLNNVPALSHTALPALKGSVGLQGPVCDGYALAFKILCGSEGIDCAFVSGLAGTAFHAWNVVPVWGRWYAVDVTFNDPVSSDSTPRAVSGLEHTYYLLIGQESDDNGYAFWLTHFAGNLAVQVSDDQTILLGSGPVGELEAYSGPGEISAWALSELTQAENSGLIPGFSSPFSFPGPVTRLQFAELVVNMVEQLTGESLTPATADTFSDTRNISVLKAYQAGLVNGTGAGLYDPDAQASREQIATLLYRAIVYLEDKTGTKLLSADGSLAAFSDAAQVSGWAQAGVSALSASGIMTGTSQSTLSPQDSCSVEQAIVLILRTANRV